MQVVQQLTTPRKLSPEARLRYWDHLHELDSVIFASAISAYLRDQKYFPTIADIRRHARACVFRAYRVPSAGVAWASLARELTNPYRAFQGEDDEELHPVVERTIETLGGYDEIASYFKGPDSSDNRRITHIRTQFTQAYERVALDWADWATTLPLPEATPVYHPQLVDLSTELFIV